MVSQHLYMVRLPFILINRADKKLLFINETSKTSTNKNISINKRTLDVLKHLSLSPIQFQLKFVCLVFFSDRCYCVHSLIDCGFQP